MAIKNITEYLDYLFEIFLKKEGCSVEEFYKEENAIRISESKLQYILHSTSRSKAGFKIYYSGYKKGNGYNMFVNKRFSKFAYSRISKLNIYKEKIKRSNFSFK